MLEGGKGSCGNGKRARMGREGVRGRKSRKQGTRGGQRDEHVLETLCGCHAVAIGEKRSEDSLAQTTRSLKRTDDLGVTGKV